MKLGLITDVDELQKPQWVTYDEDGYDADEEKVRFLIRPWTRTTQAVVDRKAKSAGIALEGTPKGSGDPKSEKYTRALADYLLVDWENVVAAGTKEPLPCDGKMKMFLFENIDLAVWIIGKAKDMSSVRVEEERKNSEG